MSDGDNSADDKVDTSTESSSDSKSASDDNNKKADDDDDGTMASLRLRNTVSKATFGVTLTFMILGLTSTLALTVYLIKNRVSIFSRNGNKVMV